MALHQQRDQARRTLLLAAALGLTLLTTACGTGSKTPPVASLGTTPTAKTTTPTSAPPMSSQQETAVDTAYAACLNAHGVEAKAIPGGGVGFIRRPGVPGPGSPQFALAEKDCRSLLPKGGLPAPTPAQIRQQTAQMLKLAQCMRSHGVPTFPDPSADGSLRITPSMGINPNSPSFQAAQKSCKQYFPGGTPP